MSGDLALSTLDPAERAELRSTIRAAADESGFPSRARDLEGQGAHPGLDAELWRVLAEEIGIAGVGLPDAAGGLGGLAEILDVAEELGAALAPVPYLTSTVLAGQILAACGDAATPYLERIVSGEIAAAAVTDRAGRLGEIACTCDGASVTGSVRFVAYGTSAAFHVVAALIGDDVDLFIVEAGHAQARPLPSLDFTRPSATVTFDSSAATRLTNGGSGAAALERGVDIALLATAADQLGGAQRCFDMTLEYIKFRRQFNREIGSFQAIKHRMADALMLVEMARSGLDRATWEHSDQPSVDAAVVKAWCTDAYNAVVAETIQLHGGVGFTWEHDAHLYFRRARYDAAFLGDATYHRARIAALLDW
jgi:alkylation response protein AidB-like acyl-CoA dehydrogenase